MSDAVADRERPTRFYMFCVIRSDCAPIHVFVTALAIPNYIRLVWTPGKDRSMQCFEEMTKPAANALVAKYNGAMIVCRFAGIHSVEPYPGSGFYHKAFYLAVEPTPQKVFTSWEWEDWLREHDTAGDILNPRVDSEAG